VADRVAASLDPERFAGLPETLVWTEPLAVDQAPCWASANAAEVARMRGTGMTHERLASHFGKSVPTVGKALRIAAEEDASAGQLPRKMPRACWAKDHAAEVAALKAGGSSVRAIAEALGKSEPTIRAALANAVASPPQPSS
jgi:DNA-binding CsgD family transcriptional regulator